MNKKIFNTIGEKCIVNYPDRIPVIIYCQNNKIKPIQFLAKNSMTVSCLLAYIRKKIKISYSQSLDISINGILISPTETIELLYPKYKNTNDGCIHMTVSAKNIFKN